MTNELLLRSYRSSSVTTATSASRSIPSTKQASSQGPSTALVDEGIGQETIRHLGTSCPADEFDMVEIDATVPTP